MNKKHRTLAEDYLAGTARRTAYTRMPEAAHRHATKDDPRPGWEDLPEQLREDLIAAGETAAGRDWPQLLASDYMEFSRTGNRVHFEDKYFARRRMLTALVMAECAEGKGRFLGKITDGLYLILEENGWCLPAHNAYVRDSVQYPLQDHARPVIDLFAAETAAILGVAEYLLRDELCKISPFISSYVNAELSRRIFVPYLFYHFWWMGGEGQMLNWTPWITQNVLLAMATRPGKVRNQDQILRQAAKSVDYFLDEYADDGCCAEGAQYYSHAGLCLWGCLHLISELTGARHADGIDTAGSHTHGETTGNFSAIFSETLICNIASYIVNMYVGKGYYINFADCSPYPGRRTARDFLFAKAVGNEVMASFCAEDFREQSRTQRLDPEEENLWYHVLGAFTYQEMLDYPETTAAPEDVWYPGSGLMVARTICNVLPAGHKSTADMTGSAADAAGQKTGDNTERYVLAAKAGCNGDPHNHNDVGSVTLYKNEQPFLIDLGVETYTARTFSKDRYEIWTMQSCYHNLPTFLDDSRKILQKDGPEYAAADVSCHMDSAASILSADIAPAYPDPRIRHYTRTVTLYKNQDAEFPITIEDHYDGDLPCVLSLMTYRKPEIETGGRANKFDGKPETDDMTENAGHRALIRIGTLGQIQVEGAAAITVETCPIRDARLGIAWKHDCYRILIRMEKTMLRLTIQ